MRTRGGSDPTSAFIVCDSHIDALVYAGLTLPTAGRSLSWIDADPNEDDRTHAAGSPWGPGMLEWYDAHRQELTAETADRTGAMLLAENRRSVNHRYDEDELDPVVENDDKLAPVVEPHRAAAHERPEHLGGTVGRDGCCESFCRVGVRNMLTPERRCVHNTYMTETTNPTTTKGELDHGEYDTVSWVAVRWLDTDYVECDRVVAEHGQWDDDDRVEVITKPTGALCDAHRDQIGLYDEWTETAVRADCTLVGQ